MKVKFIGSLVYTRVVFTRHCCTSDQMLGAGGTAVQLLIG
jgi:hypothetical protein